MTIVASGPISLTNIQTEFGGGIPISLLEYYKGGLYVNGSVTASIPYSGTISISQFYGALAITRPLISLVSVGVLEGYTTYVYTCTIYTSTTNLTGTTQYYSVVLYYNYGYYSTITIAVSNGANYGLYTLASISKTANYGSVLAYPFYGVSESVSSNTIWFLNTYDSLPPAVQGVVFSVSEPSPGPGSVTWTYTVNTNRINLTGGVLLYLVYIHNVDTPDYIADSSTIAYLQPSSSTAVVVHSQPRINVGSAHVVSTYISCNGYISNSSSWTASY